MKFRIRHLFTTLIIAFSLTNLSCAIVKQLKGDTDGGKGSVGKTAAQIKQELGDPIVVTKANSTQEVWYYKGRWLILSKNVVTHSDWFSSLIVNTEVNSYFDDEIAENIRQATFDVYSGTEAIKTNDLEFKSHSRAVINLLKSVGMKRKADDPDYFVLFSYGISDPIVDVDVSYTPTFAYVPGQTVTTSGYAGSTRYSSTTNTQGQVVGTGSVPVYTKTTSFKRYAVISIYKNAKEKSSSQQVWKCVLQSVGAASDLRPILGIMIGVAQEYVLKESNGRMNESRPYNDPMSVLAFSK